MRSRGDERLPGADAVIERLDRIAKLLAVLVAEGKTQTEAVLRLSDVGFAPREIAELLGTTANTVRVTLYTKRARQVAGQRRLRQAPPTRPAVPPGE